MATSVRVRFCPSPTGVPHVGLIRTALFNWAFARHNDGRFVFRIEDTDAARNRPEWTEGILDALDWIGIKRGTYEGPYFQSAYHEEHHAACTRLYEERKAYYCDCTRESVEERTVRFRTVGDLTLTGCVQSEAGTTAEIIDEIAIARVTERGATRGDDKFSEAAMEDRKKEGYF